MGAETAVAERKCPMTTFYCGMGGKPPGRDFLPIEAAEGRYLEAKAIEKVHGKFQVSKVQCSTLEKILEEGSCWVQRSSELSRFISKQMVVLHEKISLGACLVDG